MSGRPILIFHPEFSTGNTPFYVPYHPDALSFNLHSFIVSFAPEEENILSTPDLFFYIHMISRFVKELGHRIDQDTK